MTGAGSVAAIWMEPTLLVPLAPRSERAPHSERTPLRSSQIVHESSPVPTTGRQHVVVVMERRRLQRHTETRSCPDRLAYDSATVVRRVPICIRLGMQSSFERRPLLQRLLIMRNLCRFAHLAMLLSIALSHGSLLLREERSANAPFLRALRATHRAARRPLEMRLTPCAAC